MSESLKSSNDVENKVIQLGYGLVNNSDHSYKQIFRALNLSLSNVTDKLAEARKKLKSHVSIMIFTYFYDGTWISGNN